MAVDGQRREAEDGKAGAVGRKVDEHAERVARPAVVHVAHVGAEVRVLSSFDLHPQTILSSAGYPLISAAAHVGAEVRVLRAFDLHPQTPYNEGIGSETSDCRCFSDQILLL